MDSNRIPREEAILISEDLKDIENINKNLQHQVSELLIEMKMKLELPDMPEKTETPKLYWNLKFKFPKLNESIVRPWVKKYKCELISTKPQASFTIGTKRGRPTVFSTNLD